MVFVLLVLLVLPWLVALIGPLTYRYFDWVNKKTGGGLWP